MDVGVVKTVMPAVDVKSLKKLPQSRKRNSGAGQRGNLILNKNFGIMYI